MKLRPYSIVLLALAIFSGILVLAGTFVTQPFLAIIREYLLRWAAILTGVAVLVGILNLLRVHWIKITQPKPGGGYSLVLLIAFIITLMVAAVDTPTGNWSLWIFQYVQLPVETSLLALLAILLIVAAARLLYRKPDRYSILFLGVAILLLAGATYLPGFDIPVIRSLRDWILEVPVLAGARGLLLGIGLGVLLTGIRILLGADRPYEQ